MDITKFGLQNFRVFKEHFEFELAPIMVLTGPNSSGKSSMTKALLLLKANQETINRFQENRKISYSKGEHELGHHRLVINEAGTNTIFSFSFFEDYKFQIQISNEGKLIKDYIIADKSNQIVIAQSRSYFEIYLLEFVRYLKERLLHINDTPKSLTSKIDIEKLNQFLRKLDDFSQKHWKIDLDLMQDIDLQRKVNGTYSEDKSNIIKKNNLNTGILTQMNLSKELQSQLLRLNNIELLIFLIKKITKVDLTTDEILFLIPTMENIKDSVNGFFQFSRITYINTLKEPFKRSYSRSDMSVFQSFINDEFQRKSSNSNIDIDFKYFIKANDKSIIGIRRDRRKEYENFIRKWMKEFQIGEEISCTFDQMSDVSNFRIDNKSLLEYGFGYGSIYHILVSLNDIVDNKWGFAERKDLKISFPPTYIIEEPETGLHPDFQSKMAEMIVDIQKTFRVHIIVETHSVYFIRKLQYLTATKEINPGDAVIYYFNNPKKIPEGEEQIKKITIEKDGSLTDNFGPGFIDEETNLKFELLRLNKNRQN